MSEVVLAVFEGSVTQTIRRRSVVTFFLNSKDKRQDFVLILLNSGLKGRNGQVSKCLLTTIHSVFIQVVVFCVKEGTHL